MVAYSFKKRFVPPILSGIKGQTIRAPRKGRSRHARPGDTVQLYTAMRTLYCTLIGTATCETTIPVTLDFTDTDGGNRVMTDRATIQSADALDAFARMDGFEDWAELRAFWAKQHPTITVFDGILIRWIWFKPAPSKEETT